jgi:hypothetical protein
VENRPTLTIEDAKKLAWKRGLLSFKLYKHQIPMYNDIWSGINNIDCLKYTINCSRRFGKSTVLCIIAIEYALKNPNSQVRFAAPTAKMLKKITQPIFRQILEDCPIDIKPVYHSQDMCWNFANGAQIHLSGAQNGHEENLRGTSSNLAIVDEGGFIDDLNYVTNSILIPQLLTTQGTLCIASTPAKSPSHSFTELARECELAGNYSKFTIYENTSLNDKLISQYARESGGKDSTTFKREYLCEFVTDSASQIIPEWDDKYIESHTKTEITKYFHRYVAMDLGVKDFTAVLFGHYDFTRAVLFIEDELTLNGNELTTKTLADEIKTKEKEIFGDIEPYRRISDNNNLMLIQDLQYLNDLSFSPTTKESLEAMVNELRIMVASGRVRINSRCKMLIGCLKYGIWSENNKMFARSTTYKHQDHLAALIYLVRNLDTHSNPIPNTHNISVYTHHINRGFDKDTTDSMENLVSIFKPKKQYN